MEERDDRCAGDDDDDERILVRRRSVFGLCFTSMEEDPLYLSARRSSAATCRLVFTMLHFFFEYSCFLSPFWYR